MNWILGGSATTLSAAVVYPVFRFMSPPRVPEAETNEAEDCVRMKGEGLRLLEISGGASRIGCAPFFVQRPR